ncbi:MAG: UvrD-helicase domain-containing protein [Deltaproteobacteria bacterium]|nr:UvrD-helicase domain-containing protein [Deltaproteobacteria bacterium]
MTTDFLGVRDIYRAECRDALSETELEELLCKYVRAWFERNLPMPRNGARKSLPDEEQARAIAAELQDTLVVARAGSGKTSTIVNRAWFLHRHCGLAPREILLLAFNKKAATEVKDRLEKLSDVTWPHVMTFHALAYAIVHPEDLLFNDDVDERLYAAVQELIDAYVQDPVGDAALRKLMMTYWREDWETLAAGGHHLSKSDFLAFRRSLARETLRGEYVKSYGEKAIANFLVEHDVNYRYEAAHRWEERVYRPDFTHYAKPAGGVIVEYFGIKGDPDYDKERDQKRAYWSAKPEWHLVEVTPTEVRRDDFGTWFSEELSRHGVALRRLTEDELWERCRKRAIDRFTKATTQFIQRARKLSLSREQLVHRIAAHDATAGVETMFLATISQLYASYLERLEATGEEDFDGLLAKAAARIRGGKTTFRRKSGMGDLQQLRLIFVDEYQDFSPLFFELLAAIREKNPATRLFCVGDDWQAINGFAGSDLTYFREFERHFPDGRRLYLRTNYRSLPAIVELGNSLMGPLGGVRARAHKKAPGNVWLADLSTLAAATRRSDPGLTALKRLVATALSKASPLFANMKEPRTAHRVALLCRRNQLPWPRSEADRSKDGSSSRLTEWRDWLCKELPGLPEDRVDVSTAHKYKGLEASLVIVLDALEGSYPLVHPNWVLMRVFGDTLGKIVEDERRLFYVALTRAERVLVILTDQNRPSPFLEGLRPTASLDWSSLRTVYLDSQRLSVRIGSAEGRGSAPTWSIKGQLQAAGFRYLPGPWPCWRLSVPSNGFDLEDLFYNSAWCELANGIEIRVCDDTTGEILDRYAANGGSLERLA